MAPDASDDVIRKAYRKLAQEWHPDRHPDQREKAEFHFKEIALAYEILSDAQSRQLYDLTLSLDLTEIVEAADLEDDEELDFGDPLQPPPLSDPGDPVWSPYEQPHEVRKPTKLKDRLKETDPVEKSWEGCSHCASVPAISVNLRGVGPTRILRSPTVMVGPFCRSCGLAKFRDLTNVTLLFGWFGPLPIVSNVQTLLGNLRSRNKLRALVPPARPESAGSSFPEPLFPGRSVFLRPAMLILFVALFAGLWFGSGRGLPLPGRFGGHHAGKSGDTNPALDRGSTVGQDADGTEADSLATAADSDGSATVDREKQLLRLKDHPVAVLSFSGQPALGWIGHRLGMMSDTGTDETDTGKVWRDLGLATDQPAHIVIWQKNQQLTTTWFLPVSDRAGLDALIASHGKAQDNVPYITLKTDEGPLYLENLRTHVRISDEPQYLRFPEDTCTQLQNNLQDRAHIALELWPKRMQPGMAQEAAAMLQAAKGSFQKNGLPTEGLSLLSQVLLNSKTQDVVRNRSLEYMRLRVFPTPRGIRVEMDGRLPKDHELNEKTHRIIAPAPTSLITVPPEGYGFITIDRHIRDFMYIDPYLRPIAQWLVGTSRAIRREVELGLQDWLTTVDDFTLSGAFFGAKRHAVQFNATISGHPLDTHGQDLWSYVRTRLLSRLGGYLHKTVPRDVNNWTRIHDYLAVSARHGYLRGDQVVDPPLKGLVFRLGDAGFEHLSNRNVEAFRTGFGQFLGLITGNTGSQFVLSAGSEAKSATWLSARSTRTRHPEIDRLLSLAPRNILLIAWADFEQITKALGPLQQTLCSLGSRNCSLLAEFGLRDSIAIIVGHDRNTLHFIADLPANTYSLLQAIDQLRHSRLLPNQRQLEGALENLLRPRSKNQFASRKNGPRHVNLAARQNTSGVSPCEELSAFVCETCGQQSPACTKYTRLATRRSSADCNSRLGNIIKISEFADMRMFCKR